MFLVYLCKGINQLYILWNCLNSFSWLWQQQTINAYRKSAGNSERLSLLIPVCPSLLQPEVVSDQLWPYPSWIGEPHLETLQYCYAFGIHSILCNEHERDTLNVPLLDIHWGRPVYFPHMASAAAHHFALPFISSIHSLKRREEERGERNQNNLHYLKCSHPMDLYSNVYIFLFSAFPRNSWLSFLALLNTESITCQLFWNLLSEWQ